MRRLGSVKEVAQNSDIVITAVGKPYQIREVLHFCHIFQCNHATDQRASVQAAENHGLHRTLVSPSVTRMPPKIVGFLCLKLSGAQSIFHSCVQVVLGETGLFAGMRQGAMWIDHTTSSYEQTIELTGEATKQGFRPVECPVTGGRCCSSMNL